MSKYTTEVRYICEMNSGYPVDKMRDYTVDQIITASRKKIFNFSYPIYDESHRAELETKILKHYYTREIGAETFELWRTWLNERMNLIMPEYNPLYKTADEILDKMLNNIDVKRDMLREDDFRKTGNTSGNSNLSETHNSNGETRDKYSDTPQGTVGNVDNSTYLTDYRNITNTMGESRNQNANETSASNETNYGNQTITEHEYGYRGNKTYYELLEDYKDKIVNIDRLIIERLENLFMLLW